MVDIFYKKDGMILISQSETDLVNLSQFTGSIRSYVEETKPDAVVVLLCEKNIKPIDSESYDTHTNYFDFR